MIIHQVISTEKVPFSYRVAGIGARSLAWLIDLAFLILLFLMGILPTHAEPGWCPSIMWPSSPSARHRWPGGWVTSEITAGYLPLVRASADHEVDGQQRPAPSHSEMTRCPVISLARRAELLNNG